MIDFDAADYHGYDGDDSQVAGAVPPSLSTALRDYLATLGSARANSPQASAVEAKPFTGVSDATQNEFFSGSPRKYSVFDSNAPANPASAPESAGRGLDARPLYLLRHDQVMRSGFAGPPAGAQPDSPPVNGPSPEAANPVLNATGSAVSSFATPQTRKPQVKPQPVKPQPGQAGAQQKEKDPGLLDQIRQGIGNMTDAVKQKAADAAQAVKNKGAEAERRAVGHSISMAIRGASWVLPSSVKPQSPYSEKMVEHYFDGSGEKVELGEIPKEWQDWIVKQTGGRPGRYELSPYNSGIYDLRNSLGHFVVVVKVEKDGTRSYDIQKPQYQFGFTPNDKKQQHRHGFGLGKKLSDDDIKRINSTLPSTVYHNPGGFDERMEVRREKNGEVILYIPHEHFKYGKPFAIHGRFSR